MRSRSRAAVLVLVVVLLLTGTACSQPSMTRQDARTFAGRALTHVGFTGVSVSSEVTLASYRSLDPKFRNQKPVSVWRTHGTVPEGTIELYVPRRGNSAVFVRDEATAGGPLLTDRQFRLLRDFRYNPAADRRRNRLQSPTVVAVVLAVLVACGLFFAYFFGKIEPVRRSGPDEAEGANESLDKVERQPEPVP